MKSQRLRGLILLLSIIGGISALNLQAQTLEAHKKKVPDSNFIVKPEKSNLQTSKGQSYALQKHPAKILRKKAPTSRILDKGIEKKDTTTTKTKVSLEEPGWVTIMNEDFEGYFPGAGWDVFDGNGYDYGEYYWDDDNFRPYEGSWSAWCARGGINGLDPEWNNYPDNCDSWMVYGPFSLSDAVDAELLCYYWLKSEYCCDTFFYLASIDNIWYSGWSIRGNSGGFGYINFDLTDVSELGNLCGQPFVWIAFIFNSDESNTDQGAFVDNIVLRKNIVTPDLVIQRITPSKSNPTKGESISVDMVIKNRGNVDASNFYTG
ncbi:MAG: hypothetical protein MUO78_08880, partial [candidate division Zixibacteria bacterium]|nr:hypothetical protein [candidate division Zixibacteria bacterium]